MSGEKKSTLLHIRTYAHDLDEQRKKASPEKATTEVHTVTAEPVVVSKPKPTAVTYQPKVTPVESKTIFPPQEKIETPLHEIEKSLAQPERTDTVPMHIPAFHELEQELQKNINPKKPDISAFSQPYDKPTPPKTSKIKKFEPQKVRDTIALSGGTVITDTKRADFSLFGAIMTSIQEFFAAITRQFNKAESPPKYTVETTERRRGVIQKATSKTGAIFTADNETLKEEILRRQREQAAKPEISWSPNTDVGYPLLENKEPQPAISNVAVVYKHETVPRFAETPAVPEPVAERTEEDRRWSEPVRVVTSPPRVILPPPLLPQPEPEPVFIPVPIVVAPVPVTQVAPPAPKPVPKPKVKRVWFSGIKNRLNSLKDGYFVVSNISSNLIALTIVGVIAGVVVIALVSRPLIAILIPSTVTILEIAMKPSLINAEKNGSILFTTGSVNSVEQIVNAGVSTTGTGITEIRFLDTNEAEINPQTLFTLFGFRTNPNFNQSVTTLRLLSLDAMKRGILFEVTDPTTVFGAMLEWETKLYADSGELLDLVVTQPESGRFIDRTIGQSDVRILVVNGQEILIYGFISSNLLLITNNSTEFTRILQSQ